MPKKVAVNSKMCACPKCDYQWDKQFGSVDLEFNEEERCLCCPKCGELIEDGDDSESK